jgi:diguanylate cyclase (GGDEF)-like protein
VSWIEQEKNIFVKEEQERALPRETFSRIYGTMGDMGTELAIPIFYKGRLKGILTLGAKGSGEPYVQSDIDLLEALASQAAIAIENAQLYEEAITDGLTGLYHHKYFKIRLTEELERSRRHKRPLGLMMIDIDDFKRTNDAWGHLTGDSVLKAVAAVLKASIRAEDIAARYGGDELAIILPETSGEEAKFLGERLRRMMESLRLKEGLSITVSIGVGCSDEHSPASDNKNLIERADNALYRAKQNGKNRMEIGS